MSMAPDIKITKMLTLSTGHLQAGFFLPISTARDPAVWPTIRAIHFGETNMANYYASARSNYFRVKDDDAFLDAMTPFEVEASKDNDGRWLLIDVSGDANGWPFVVFDEATDEYEDIHFPEVVAPHLADGEVCILMEVGREKLRYLSGYAIAFNNKGEEKRVSLNDIYELATDLGTNITDCTY